MEAPPGVCGPGRNGNLSWRWILHQIFQALKTSNIHFFCMKIVILQNDKLKRLNDVLDIMAYNKKDNLVFLEVDLISKVRCKGRWTWRKGSSNLLPSIGLKKTTYIFRSPSVLQSEGGILAQAVEDQGSRVGKSPWWRSSNISSSSLSPLSSGLRTTWKEGGREVAGKLEKGSLEASVRWSTRFHGAPVKRSHHHRAREDETASFHFPMWAQLGVSPAHVA